MKVLDTIQLCAREFNDIAYERIARDSVSAANPNQANWLDWLNDALRTTVLVRPDANAETVSVLLVAGTKQALAAGKLRILDVIRNMGANGLTAGKSIRLVDLAQKSSVNRDWHTEADVGVVREVMYDDKKDPLTFYVSPPAAAKYIELTLSKAPTAVLAANVAADDLPLNDIYAGPVQAWMLHRAHGVGTNSQVNLQKSWQYFSSFFNQLGVKIKSELFTAVAQPGQLPVADLAQKAAYP